MGKSFGIRLGDRPGGNPGNCKDVEFLECQKIVRIVAQHTAVPWPGSKPYLKSLFKVVAAVTGVPGGVTGQEAKHKEADEEDNNDVNGDFKGQHETAPEAPKD